VRPFGAILAGGESSRYGSPKALATVGGERIIERVLAALQALTPDIILSANEPELFEYLALPTYPDERPDLGPLGGIHTALLRAREAGRPGVLAVACDMPFPSSRLLARLAELAFGWSAGSGSAGTGDSYSGSYSDSVATARAPDIVLPASAGPRGVEPLFAAYRTSCIPAIEAALADGDRRMIGFHERVAVRTIPLDEVEALCDPATAFLNVNTPEDRARAEAIAAGSRTGPGTERSEGGG
jgi:molybdopterin-guanine dinucleotide biosynthesis protein A